MKSGPTQTPQGPAGHFTLQKACENEAYFPLVPKVSAALWERASR